MKITITIPDDKKEAIVDAFALQYGYQDTIPNPDYSPETKESLETITNPSSKEAFAKNILVSFIKQVYISGQVEPLEEQKKTIMENAKVEVETISIT